MPDGRAVYPTRTCSSWPTMLSSGSHDEVSQMALPRAGNRSAWTRNFAAEAAMPAASSRIIQLVTANSLLHRQPQKSRVEPPADRGADGEACQASGEHFQRGRAATCDAIQEQDDLRAFAQNGEANSDGDGDHRFRARGNGAAHAGHGACKLPAMGLHPDVVPSQHGDSQQEDGRVEDFLSEAFHGFGDAGSESGDNHGDPVRPERTPIRSHLLRPAMVRVAAATIERMRAASRTSRNTIIADASIFRIPAVRAFAYFAMIFPWAVA
jgi:hypothetical protein